MSLHPVEKEVLDFNFDDVSSDCVVDPGAFDVHANPDESAPYPYDSLQAEIREYLDHVEEAEAISEILAPATSQMNEAQASQAQEVPEDDVLRCSSCAAPFRNRAALEKHYRRVHQVSQTISSSNRCEICSAVLKDVANKNRHIQRVHEGKHKHQCTKCEAYYNSSARLAAHFAEHHSETQRVSRSAKRVSERSLYECGSCTYSTSRKDNLARHLHKMHRRKYRGEGVHKCNTCDRRFTRKCNLAAHINKYHK